MAKEKMTIKSAKTMKAVNVYSSVLYSCQIAIMARVFAKGQVIEIL